MANKMSKYVVMCDAAVITVGKKDNGKPEYTRVMRGGVINSSGESSIIKDLLRRGSIVQAHNNEEIAELRHPLKRQTVKDAAGMAGAPDDPALEPMKSVEVFDAPLPTTSPDAILASAE